MNFAGMNLSKLDDTEKRELYELLRLKDIRAKRNKLAAYGPYAKQMEFHDVGSEFRERLFMAGNQLGKTWAGAFEVAMHATGIYPSWWTGKRFPYATRGMVGSESAELTRKGVQRLLLGPPEIREEWGTGAIPHANLRDTSMKHGVADAVSSIVVRHVCGEDSVIQFNSYDQGRTKWQADTVDYVWFDEEPPLSIYSEGLTRTNATGGLVFVTFTPLLGMSEVVKRFLLDKPASSTVTTMTINDAEHYTQEQRRVLHRLGHGTDLVE
jgi:phage terminase large subunit-like protein